jgi:hypothetical protein
VSGEVQLLQAGDPEAALVALEQGRGVLLSYALDARTEFTDLEEAHPALAAEVRRILDELDQDDDPGRDGVSDRPHQLRCGGTRSCIASEPYPASSSFRRPHRSAHCCPQRGPAWSS